ncbi:hypothetical protein ACHAPJ_007864 [Fusarium lateritium]
MPAPGDQHTTVTNPFEEQRPRVAEWAAKDIATISAKLDKQLGPEYISARAGPGGTKVHYLTAEKCITLANEVFGFNGWSSSIQNIQVDFADENPQTQRVSIGLSVIVRITLRDGTYHEDIGYGSIENAKGKAMAFEKAKKEGTTDGLKRALRSFGNVLGNCIYDKDYVKQVTKMKAEPVKKFDQDNLHRHADFIKRDVVRAEPAAPAAPPAPVVKTEPPPPLPVAESFDDYLGELDEADFCVPEDGHPDEIMLSTSILGQAANEKSSNNAQVQRIQQQPSRSNSAGPPNRAPQTPIQGQQRPDPLNGPNALSNRAQGGPSGRTTPNQIGNPRPQPNVPQNMPETVGFFSAKAVNQLPESTLEGSTNARLSLPQGQQAFNPKAESPSIRKTPGIDHNSSKPVAKNGQHVAPTSSQANAAPAAPAPRSNTSSFTPVRPSMPSSQSARGNVVNPSLDQTRRIGAPAGPGSPLANRGSYRPPAMKRPNPADGRTALADLPANGNGGATPAAPNGLDAKRQKMA